MIQMNNIILTEKNRLIRRKEVQIKTGLGASSIYALMKQGTPTPYIYPYAGLLGLNPK
jgi:predicted DNA-binding transcriptional regulator AlpA